jgi:hypothetical protein
MQIGHAETAHQSAGDYEYTTKPGNVVGQFDAITGDQRSEVIVGALLGLVLMLGASTTCISPWEKAAVFDSTQQSSRGIWSNLA